MFESSSSDKEPPSSYKYSIQTTRPGVQEETSHPAGSFANSNYLSSLCASGRDAHYFILEDTRNTTGTEQQVKGARKTSPGGAGKWSVDEICQLLSGLIQHGRKWNLIAEQMGTRVSSQVRQKGVSVLEKVMKEFDLMHLGRATSRSSTKLHPEIEKHLSNILLSFQGKTQQNNECENIDEMTANTCLPFEAVIPKPENQASTCSTMYTTSSTNLSSPAFSSEEHEGFNVMHPVPSFTQPFISQEFSFGNSVVLDPTNPGPQEPAAFLYMGNFETVEPHGASDEYFGRSKRRRNLEEDTKQNKRLITYDQRSDVDVPSRQQPSYYQHSTTNKISHHQVPEMRDDIASSSRRLENTGTPSSTGTAVKNLPPILQALLTNYSTLEGDMGQQK